MKDSTRLRAARVRGVASPMGEPSDSLLTTIIVAAGLGVYFVALVIVISVTFATVSKLLGVS